MISNIVCTLVRDDGVFSSRVRRSVAIFQHQRMFLSMATERDEYNSTTSGCIKQNDA